MSDGRTLAGIMGSKQKAIGWILLLPSYLYYVPTIINFIIKLYIDHLTGEANILYLGVILNFGVGLICCAMTVFALKDFCMENMKACKENLLENIIWACSIGIGITYGLSIVSNLVVMLFLGNESSGGSANQQLFNAYFSNGPLLMIVQAVIFAPILEELLFRGIIFRTLRDVNKKMALFVSALLFGLLHVYAGLLSGDMTQWIYMIPYVAMGYAFGYAYEKRGNICVPMMIHMLNNTIAILLNLIISKV